MALVQEEEVLNYNLVQSLSDGIVEMMLLKLPVKSLLRFKCIARDWQNFIASQRFARKHFNLAHSPNHRILVKCGVNQAYSLDVDEPLNNAFQFGVAGIYDLRFRVPRLEENSEEFAFLGSCRGFVFVYFESYMVWNPSTGSKRFFKGELDKLYGLVYQENGDKYSIIMLSFLQSETADTTILSVNDDSWSVSQRHSIPAVKSGNQRLEGLFLEGALHWICCSSEQSEYYPLTIILVYHIRDRSLTWIELSEEMIDLGITNQCLYLSD